jgi:hypothetical protein
MPTTKRKRKWQITPVLQDLQNFIGGAESIQLQDAHMQGVRALWTQME